MAEQKKSQNAALGQNQTSATQPPVNQGNGGSGKGILIGCLIAVILFLIVIGGVVGCACLAVNKTGTGWKDFAVPENSDSSASVDQAAD